MSTSTSSFSSADSDSDYFRERGEVLPRAYHSHGLRRSGRERAQTDLSTTVARTAYLDSASRVSVDGMTICNAAVCEHVTAQDMIFFIEHWSPLLSES